MPTRIRRYEQGVIGLPASGEVVAISNSEIGKIACERRYWYSGIEHYRSPSTRKMDLGTAWDAIIEDIFLYFASYDRAYPDSGLDQCAFCLNDGMECPYCDSTGRPALYRAMAPFWQAYEKQEIEREECERVEEQLRRAAVGWLRRYHRGPFDNYQVVGTQIPLARPILDPRIRQPFRPVTYLEEREDGVLIPATTAAIQRGRHVKAVQWPYYYVGILDCLLRDRKSGSALVLDVKYTGDQKSYERKMGYDPQLPGYCWLVEGHMKSLEVRSVFGFMYDCTSSVYHQDPHRLQWKAPTMEEMRVLAEKRGIPTKGIRKTVDMMAAMGISPGHGRLSKAQNVTVPSWIYEAAIESARLDRAEYADHINWLIDNVDPGLYSRPFSSYSDEQGRRFEAELFAKARKLAQLRATAATLPYQDGIRRIDLDIEFPRDPICQQPGGSCPFAGICEIGGLPGATMVSAPAQEWGILQRAK